MSHITLAQQGLEAADARRWDEAITKLSKAVQSSPNPAWLVARSKALIGAGRFREALGDAEVGWHQAHARSRRPLMADAHYRRAVAHFRLGELANADCCCRYAMRLLKGAAAVERDDPAREWVDGGGFWAQTLEDAKAEARDDPMNQNSGKGGMDVAMGAGAPSGVKEWRRASTLRMQILFAMEKLPADDDGRKLTVGLKPKAKELSDLTTGEPRGSKSEAAGPAKSASQAAAKPPVPSDAPLRVQDFQTNTSMSVSIFTKGVDREKLQVKFLPNKVDLMPIVYPNGEEKGAQFDLWAEIDPAGSKYSVTPNKVELTLAKKTPAKWKQPFSDTQKLEDTPKAGELKTPKQAQETAAATTDTPQEPETTAAAPSTTSSTDKGKAPAAGGGQQAYPTSSASGPKDWDAIAGASGDKSDDDDDEGRDVNFFFKKLYKNATPEQQRAMMKSFTESNGTSLSTDWDDVKGRKVDTVPPEGVEAKKWD